jgi:hypothetical protein
LRGSAERWEIRRSALLTIALWVLPLLAFAFLRASASRKWEEAAARAAADAAAGPARIDGDGQAWSPSPAGNVAALTPLPYILQSYDPHPESGVVVHDPARTSRGVNFFYPWSRKPPRAYLIDLDGRILWRWGLDGYVHEGGEWLEGATLLPDGAVLFCLADRGIVKVDRDSKVLWEARFRVHHDVWPAPGGDLGALAPEPVAAALMGLLARRGEQQ